MSIGVLSMSKELIKKIKKYDSIVIFGHLNPDGDCYGSEVGLKEAIKATFPKKKVYAVGSGFKPGVDLYGELDKVDDEIISKSLCIGVDFNTISRSEDSRLTNGLDLCMIDHHIKSEPFGSVQIIDNDAIACCEIITNIIIKEKLKLTTLGASALYLGIVTDSGRFQYNPKPRAFELAAYLLNYGVNMKQLYDRLYESDEISLKFKGYVYSHFKKTKNGVIYCVLPHSILSKYNMSGHKGAVFVNLLAGVKDCPIWVFFGEDEDGKTFVEYRSNKFNVQPIATMYGGGGHRFAAGCNVPSLEMHKEILKKLDNLIIEGK